MKTASEHLLEPMDLRGDVPGRETGNLRDGRGVHVFEIEQHDLPIDRVELPDQLVEPLQREPAIKLRLAADGIRNRLEDLRRDSYSSTPGTPGPRNALTLAYFLLALASMAAARYAASPGALLSKPAAKRGSDV